MTETRNPTTFKTLDRAPVVGDIITITPQGQKLFNVIALDELYNAFVYAEPHDPADERSAQWYSLTYVKVIDDEPTSDHCTCGHPDCGAC